MSRYSPSLDLYRSVYNESSDIVFNLVAVDRGTNPPRGASATARVKFSNTCLLSVLYEEIEVRVDTDPDTGNASLRIPGYYIYEFGEWSISC